MISRWTRHLNLLLETKKQMGGNRQKMNRHRYSVMCDLISHVIELTSHQNWNHNFTDFRCLSSGRQLKRLIARY